MAALVSVSKGVMEPLLSKLTKLLEEEYDKLRGVSKQIKFLRDELKAMSITLQVLADAEHLSDHMKHWRDQIRELTYDIEDCIDGFMARVDREDGGGPTGILGLFHKFKKLISRHEIANEIELLKARAIDASERHKRYNFVEQASNSTRSSAVDPRLPALYVEIDELVGIDGPKKHIIEWLTRQTEVPTLKECKVTVLSIVGCGGLGKTTLANQVHLKVKGQFDCAAFVSVSQNPDVRKILRDIVKEVDIKGNILDHDEKQLIDELRKHLREKRYLIVIDDIWDPKPWEIIKLALLNKNPRSRVIATTRSTAVASVLSSQGGNVYQMRSLSSNDSKRLLLKRAFGSETISCTHLGSVPDEILKKCDGLPLAIVTISSMLADQHAKSEWDRVLNGIGFALAKNPDAENMTTILSMSYFDIPYHLRACLLYLSVFPEDYHIEKQCLINRWIAEGFIQEEDGQTKYEIGEGYFNDLINRSMIQPIDVKYGQAKACRVHDIILDYIKCKAAEENFVISLDTAEHVNTSHFKVRRFSVNHSKEEHVTLWTSRVLSMVRSVTIFGYPVQTSLLPFTVLRVLDLGHCRKMEDDHLTSIERLFLLKYLRLSSSSITKLPEKVGELQYLQTLDVRGTSITELPPTVTKLQKLAHLYVNQRTTFEDGIIRQMHSLEELKEYGILSYKQGRSLREFFKLTRLRKLEMVVRWDLWDFDWADHSEQMRQAEGNHSHVGTLLSSCNLHNLHISDISFWGYPWSLHLWHPVAPCSLRKLNMKGCHIYKVPDWMGSLGNLLVLELQMIICVRPEDIAILGTIPSLLFLELATAGGTNGRIVIHGNNRFQSLKYFSLYIRFCGTTLEFEAGSMPKLEHLKLRFFAHKMKWLNSAPDLGIQHLSTLSKVELNIAGDCRDDKIERAINAAAKALPNRPTIKFENDNVECEHFQCWVREYSRKIGGVLTEWFKIWQFEEEQTEQTRDGQPEQGHILTVPEDMTNEE